MDVNMSSKSINPQQNIPAKEVQPKKKVVAQNSEADLKRNPQAVTDKISISAKGVEAQMKSQDVNGGMNQTQKTRS